MTGNSGSGFEVILYQTEDGQTRVEVNELNAVFPRHFNSFSIATASSAIRSPVPGSA
jgi:hypothetical protein